MNITKVKYDGNKVEIRWQRMTVGEQNSTVESKLTSDDPPEQEFVDALQTFKKHALNVCELPEDDEWRDKVTVTGISVNHEDDERRGLVVTMQRDLDASNAPLVINMPHLRETLSSDDNPPQNAMPFELTVAIDRMADAAERFVNGHRGQGDLFTDDGGPVADHTEAAKAA